MLRQKGTNNKILSQWMRRNSNKSGDNNNNNNASLFNVNLIFQLCFINGCRQTGVGLTTLCPWLSLLFCVWTQLSHSGQFRTTFVSIIRPNRRTIKSFTRLSLSLSLSRSAWDCVVQLKVCNSKFPYSIIYQRVLKVLLWLLLVTPTACPPAHTHTPHNCVWTEVDSCPDRIMKF